MKLKLVIFFTGWYLACLGQTIDLDVSARVDTTNAEINKVYHLYKQYINSKPDSLSQNPYWNKIEMERYHKAGLKVADNFSLFGNGNYENGSLHYFVPKILQIDKVEEGRYQIKTIFMARNEDQDYKQFSPLAVSKLYAVKDIAGNYKLENVIDYDTRKWKKYTYKFITYYVHPLCDFNKKKAKNAVSFCINIIRQFKLQEPEKITYYITPNSDELGKILNFDYWLSYSMGRAFPNFRTIYTGFNDEEFKHELLHLLFPTSENCNRPFIINEGIATWLSGPGYDETFEDALRVFSGEIKDKEVSLDEIITSKYRNTLDNNPIYLSGAVICKLVYERYGTTGIIRLLDCTQQKEGFEKLLEDLFEMSYNEVGILVINYIKGYK
ncbi:hypothetical protein R1T16_01775 [Flavobacterium sp. DG1-102-2]|uniref:hypothetical protein n=1 Tax=Flavobacterium sp. DG1-102-2 TaxID=3081663 RepID=UPI002949D480|nr:hypothetical protein [Flavobacterium sp. DG1-102-2]MDV6167134.1 hypothetical protein [Flavobacterium sp. DG1-102-2]